jgi:hypothetical protein
MSQENVEIARQGLEHFAKTGEPYWEIVDHDTEVFDWRRPLVVMPSRRAMDEIESPEARSRKARRTSPAWPSGTSLRVTSSRR